MEANNYIVFTDSINMYVNSMQGSLDETESYLSSEKLLEIHEKAKTESSNQV